ncbi:MAG: AAA family ATPase [Candidatus Thermoplasmatota archaeon]|nr:AAA family ATPase [Candidatus Thermoplasmatota archaeon]
MSSIIEDELASSSVIQRVDRLDFDYVPEELPHRDTQLRMLAQLFKQTLKGVSQNAVITGPVGSGKTAMAKKLCQELSKVARKKGSILDYVHVNCRKRSTESMVLLAVLNHFDPRFPDRGFSVQEMLEVLKRQLTRKKTHLIIVLDEADALLKKSGSDLIYDLSRFSDESSQQQMGVSLLLVSQHDILRLLDDASISTFKRSNRLNLEKYTRDELFDIVSQRVELAFLPGTVQEDSIELIADIASEWGDARFAIELLGKAGIAADHEHTDKVVPEFVRAAKAETYSVVTETKLQNLNRHQLLTLDAIANRLHRDGTAYLNTGDAEKMYAFICEQHEEKPRGHTMFWQYLKDIENAGFITVKKSGKGQLGTTQLISLPDIPAEIMHQKVNEIL